MNAKVSLVIVVAVVAHVSLWTQPCDSFPWSYLFSSADEETPGEEVKQVESTASAVTEIQAKSETPSAPVKSSEQLSSSEDGTNTSSKTRNRKSSNSGERFDVRPFMQNAGIARGPIGFFAGLAKIGTDGLRSVVQSGTELGSTTIEQASMLQDKVIDSTQNAIERGTQKSMDNIVPMMSRLDTYRRSFSGGTKADADKAHSITITTSSDAPINSMYSFAKDFMPAGATGSSALPPITSIDFSKFLR